MKTLVLVVLLISALVAPTFAIGMNNCTWDNMYPYERWFVILGVSFIVLCICKASIESLVAFFKRRAERKRMGLD